jgi:hypothetical protein
VVSCGFQVATTTRPAERGSTITSDELLPQGPVLFERYLTVYRPTFAPDRRRLLVSSVRRFGCSTGDEIHETQAWRAEEENVLSLPRLELVEFSGAGGASVAVSEDALLLTV